MIRYMGLGMFLVVLSCPFIIYLYVLIMLFTFLLVLFTWPARDKPLRGHFLAPIILCLRQDIRGIRGSFSVTYTCTRG